MRLITSSVCAALFLTVLAGTAGAERPRLLERWRVARAERLAGKEVPGAVDLMVGGLDRRYFLLDGRKGNQPAPLVIALHGGGGNGKTMIDRWQALARQQGIVIAAPNGIGRSERRGTWNASGCCGEAMTRGVDDVAFVQAVIDDVSRKIAIDPKRIYVTGFSNGGMLTHRVAIALGRRIAAAGVVSGAMFGNEARPRGPVPMLIIHGESDNVVGFEGGMSETRFVARAQDKPFLPTRASVDFWKRANGCLGASVTVRRGDVSVESNTSCRGKADVVFYDLAKGGHEWPSGATVDATRLLWDFFKTKAR